MIKATPEQLAPCPFCGGVAEFGDSNDGGRFITCTRPQCWASSAIIYPMKEDADPLLRERWNRRHAALNVAPAGEIEQKPVAWRVVFKNGEAFVANTREHVEGYALVNQGSRVEPLYAAPPTTVPVASGTYEERLRGHGIALRREDEPPIPGEPLMSMAVAEMIIREADREISALRAKIAAVPVAREAWRDIKTAPRDGKPILLWKESTREHYVAAWIHGDHPGWCTPDGYEIFRATEWQPLPAPPIKSALAATDNPEEGK